MASRQDLPWIGEPLKHLPLDLFSQYKHPTALVTGSAKNLQIAHHVLIDVEQLLAKIRDGSPSFVQDGLKNKLGDEIFIDVDYLLTRIASCSLRKENCTSTQKSEENYASEELRNSKKDSKLETAQGVTQETPSHEILINIDDILQEIEHGMAAKNSKSCGLDLSYKSLKSEPHMVDNMVS